MTNTLIDPQNVTGTPPSPVVSVIVIGRNEGDRLHRCLMSISEAHWVDTPYEVLYVDSRSTDDSLNKATQLGATTYLLEDSSPCAAKARNLGIQHAQGEFILFLDGDTILHPDFVNRALSVLKQQPDTCAAWGHRRELAPDQSLYTRVMDLDWVYPTGKTLYFGGDVLIRRNALTQVNGFDPTLKAGEEPEMCARLRAAGWNIEHIDAPMTLHDLAVRHWKPYWLRAYRSGIAYAEVAERMRLRGDVLWQTAARRDYLQGWLYTLAPLWLLIALLLPQPWRVIALIIGLAGVGIIIAKTARGCHWKAPNDSLLVWQYAVHVHLQKIPALFGQLAWKRNHRQQAELDLVDYKQSADQAAAGDETSHTIKRTLLTLLIPMARLWNHVIVQGWRRVWSLALFRASTRHAIDASNVLYGPIEVHGTGNIHLGRNALIYPGCYLETQGAGEIILGDDVVLSRGVHIVAFDRIVVGNGVMIGEYSSLRDANHRLDPTSIRQSGHDAQAIEIEDNVWLARGTTILKGVHIGRNAVVAAGAVVNRNVAPETLVGGVPAALIQGIHQQSIQIREFSMEHTASL